MASWLAGVGLAFAHLVPVTATVVHAFSASTSVPVPAHPTPGPSSASAPRTSRATAASFPSGTGDQAVAYQEDYAHDGSQPGDTLKPPLYKRWWIDLGGMLSYPLIAGGRVFVAGNGPGGGAVSRLYALDQTTGSVTWSRDLSPSGSAGAGIAYDAGTVFAIGYGDGVMRAFDAATGTLLWQAPPDQSTWLFTAPPTAVAGTVYYQGQGSGGLIYALRESDGSRLWTNNSTSGGNSAPAVDASNVYVSYDCDSAYDLSPTTGAVIWRDQNCIGGGGETPALQGGRLWVRGNPSTDVPEVYNAATGAALGQFPALNPPAFDGTTGFFLRGSTVDPSVGGTLSSVNVADVLNQTTIWTFTGDGGLRSNVLVANGTVYAGSSSGNVYALDESTGQQTWVSNAGAPIQPPNEHEGTAAGMAIGQGLLVVPATNLLVAYATCSSTCPPDPPANPSPNPGLQSTFSFAEGYTGPGFTEQLELLSPQASGAATVDYFTSTGHSSRSVNLTAGQPATVDVNSDIGPGQEVSARVTLPGPGIAERVMHFQSGQWHGSTGIVGTSSPRNEWIFAEGSTLAAFSEYLTLQNQGTSSVTVVLNYFTDSGAHPRKTFTLPPQTRTTVEVFSGDPTGDVTACTPSGPGANCGVGRGIGGVAVLAQAQNAGQFVAERVMYVDGYSFGSGPINDGHDAFGGDTSTSTWFFAEGTTLPGFDEYLTLVNVVSQSEGADVTYFTDTGQTIQKHITIQPASRYTIEVFNPTDGVGSGIGGVSAVVNSQPGVVAERPMYMVHDFGAGPVAGAHDVMGNTSPGTVFGFAAASTLAGDSDFLTIENANAYATLVTITYYVPAGPVRRTFAVPAGTRHTVQVFDTTEGIGPGYAQVGITVTATARVLVEKPTYSANSATYGATDTAGYVPPQGFF